MKLLHHFPYRKAIVRGNQLYFIRSNMKSLEIELAKMANADMDNHVCYLIEIKSYPENVKKGVMFSDGDCIIGDRVDIGSW
jgi:hypothetical protein